MYSETFDQGTPLYSETSDQGTPLYSKTSDQGTPLYSETSDQGTLLYSETSDQGTLLYSETSDQGTPLFSETSDQGTSLYSETSDQWTHTYVIISMISSMQNNYLTNNIPCVVKQMRSQINLVLQTMSYACNMMFFRHVGEKGFHMKKNLSYLDLHLTDG